MILSPCVWPFQAIPHTYVGIDSVCERIYELQNHTGKEDDKHNDRPHPLPHDHPGELHVPGNGLSQLSEESAKK